MLCVTGVSIDIKCDILYCTIYHIFIDTYSSSFIKDLSKIKDYFTHLLSGGNAWMYLPE